MNESVEIVVAAAPFTVRRTARWGDCDPAGYVYTGRYTDYLLGAVTHFLDHLRIGPGSSAGHDQGIQLPCKSMSLVFSSSMKPGDVVDIELSVSEIRAHTFDVSASAFLPDRRLAFEGKFSPICVDATVRRSLPIPVWLRERLEPHATRR